MKLHLNCAFRRFLDSENCVWRTERQTDRLEEDSKDSVWRGSVKIESLSIETSSNFL